MKHYFAFLSEGHKEKMFKRRNPALQNDNADEEFNQKGVYGYLMEAYADNWDALVTGSNSSVFRQMAPEYTLLLSAAAR